MDLELVMKLRHTTYQSRLFYSLSNRIGCNTIKVSYSTVSSYHLVYTRVGNLCKIRATCRYNCAFTNNIVAINDNGLVLMCL